MKIILFLQVQVVAIFLLVFSASAQITFPDSEVQQNRFVYDSARGGLWIMENLFLDGGEFQRYDTSKYAFALNFRSLHQLPGEQDVGVVLWVAPPGPNPIPPLGQEGSLQVGWDLTQYKDFIVGGSGVEVDGNGLKPYARFIHSKKPDTSTARYTGIIKNVFLNLIGRDDPKSESWFMGFVDDSFKVCRSAPDDSLLWSDFVHINPSGQVGIGTSQPQGALDVVSTTSGFVVPRMTKAQRDALKPVNGMIIYNTTENEFNFYEDGEWVEK
ncbi:MAG: hypothetical protein HY707_00580 [Ignavibacteriae bacterium]|nr:hypothetical protein [Ignavibacteriota bacterium]